MTVTINLRTIVAFATGLAVALIAVFVFQAWQVDAAPGDTDATLVPITPCRLIDTRPGGDRVGIHGAFSTADTTTIAAHGTNGNCTIPSDAVGLSLNVTAVGATARSFLTIWPDGTLPKASSLNPGPGQPPTPNAVTTTLSGAGSFNVFNKAGSVDVIIDINGYYTKESLQELTGRLVTAESKVATLETNTAALEAAQPFAVTNHRTVGLLLTSNPQAFVSVPVSAPVDGQVTINSTALVVHSVAGGDIFCAIFETANIPAVNINPGEPSFQRWESGLSTSGSLSGTRTFDIAAGVATSYSLACERVTSGAQINSGNLTAIFTPAP